MTQDQPNPAATIEAIKMPKQFQLPVTYDINGTHFFDANGRMILQIRGWGYLTGTGGLHLDPEVAAKVQDKAAAYIETAINNYSALAAVAAERDKTIDEFVRRVMDKADNYYGRGAADVYWRDAMASVAQEMKREA